MMVLLDDLNVKLAAQDLRSLAGQLDQYVDTHRHVCAAEDRRPGAGSLQCSLILPGKAGGEDDAGQTVGGTVLRCCNRPGG